MKYRQNVTRHGVTTTVGGSPLLRIRWTNCRSSLSLFDKIAYLLRDPRVRGLILTTADGAFEESGGILPPIQIK